MSRVRATILYESSRDRGTKEFRPHELVCALVADGSGRDIWEIRKVLLGNPRKGATKVVATIRQDLDNLNANGALAVAVLDSDRAAQQLGLPRGSCRRVILDRRREDLGEADLLERAIDQKEHLARDRVFGRAAQGASGAERAEVMNAVPSLGRLVRVLIDWL